MRILDFGLDVSTQRVRDRLVMQRFGRYAGCDALSCDRTNQ